MGVGICAELKRRGYEVRGFERAALDICDGEKVERALAEIEPSAVFNSAAYNQVDVAEREPLAAYEANALGVRNIALACRQNDARLIHFSTDYVFDGKLGRPYVETDPTHPLGAYAVSKLAGEFYAQAYLERADYRPDFRSVRARWIAHGARQFPRTDAAPGARRQADTGGGRPHRFAHLCARAGEPLHRFAGRDLDGVFHMGGGEPISWFDFAHLIFEKAGVTANLTPTNEREYRTAANRPKFSALENARMRVYGIAAMPPLAEAVERYLASR